MPEFHPLSTAEVEAKLVRVCQVRRMARHGERETTESDLRKFWHGIGRHAGIERETLAEVLGLLSGDPADEHYFDRLWAWEQEEADKIEVASIKENLEHLRRERRKWGVLS